MTSSTISKNQDQYSFDVAALVSILRKRIILIILVTLTPFLISVFWVLSRPAVYVSELQLLALKFNDQKNIT